ncbi:putative nonessential protein required for the fusion of transport vesicles derived from the endocytic pathway with the Golgi complex [Lyophyllum shimeji]|uniref:Protein transport protein SFT2 n=1 Tax=Lyophyllum shimeji TaxID=47721 RepID=A0A9P3PZT2_LYOSH|nr:putative nonessential protein required for the fusion of transport vesicles derived from the endocytic pathway with the Golgi complex [Lyophyllum shimeji]
MPPAASSEQTFRTNLSQFRWARGNTDDSQQAAQAPAGNPFSRFYNTIAGDYIPLRSSERSNEDEAWFALSSWERLLGFGGCLVGAAVCFFVSFLTLPILPVRPAKFALSFSLGSLLVMLGFSVLIGPVNHIKHLISKERLPFSVVYFASLGLTLYFSLGPRSYLGSLICGGIQVVALVALAWEIHSYIVLRGLWRGNPKIVRVSSTGWVGEREWNGQARNMLETCNAPRSSSRLTGY